MIVSKTPFRMSFVGGGSDLPGFYREEMGAVVSTAIDKYMYIAVNRKFDQKIRISYSRTEEVETPHQIEHPLVRHVLDVAGIDGGIEITSMADIPSRGTGLGSSSLTPSGCSTRSTPIGNQFASRTRWRAMACEIEIERCGEPIGKQDQYAAAYGGLNRFASTPTTLSRWIPIICDVRPVRTARGVDAPVLHRARPQRFGDPGGQSASIAANRRLMRRMVQLAFDLKIELESGRLESVGEILHENWCLKKQMTDGISDGQIDEWYETAQGERRARRQAPRRRQRRVHDVLRAARPAHADQPRAARPEALTFRFDRTGSQIVFYQPMDSAVSTGFSVARYLARTRGWPESSTSARSRRASTSCAARSTRGKQIITAATAAARTPRRTTSPTGTRW